MHPEKMPQLRRPPVLSLARAFAPLIGFSCAVLTACQGPPGATQIPPPAAADSAVLSDEDFFVTLPAGLATSSLRNDLAEQLSRAGIRLRHVYSERVGLAGTFAVRAPRDAVLAAAASWPGLTITPAMLRFLDACGDTRCEPEEAASATQSSTCSLDCGVPRPRAERNEFNNSYGAIYTSALAAWAYSRGAGVDVCVIDTGYDHGAASTHRDRPRNLLSGYNFFDDNADYSAVDTHGTHVAGLLAAPDNNYGMTGAAPDANLRIYNVFGRYRGRLGASDVDIVAALDRAVADRCRIVNMSFGAPAPSPLEERALSAAYAAGVLLIAAAGNAEDSAHGAIRTADSHYPASYREVLAIGATDPEDRIADFSSTGRAVGLTAPGVSLYSTFPVGTGDREARLSCSDGRGSEVAIAAWAPLASSGTTLDKTALRSCGFGSPSELAACAPAGRIALIRRGPSDAGQKALPFSEKVENARSAGAAGIVLYNHRSGEAAQAGRLLTNIEVGNVAPVPILAIAAGDGEYLAERLAAGMEVRCSLSSTATDHAFLDGTSMAAPLASGVAALLASRYPGLSNVALRQLLQETATDLGAPGRDDSYGFGAIDALAAIKQATPAARCGDGKLQRESEICDGALVSRALPSCDELGYDSAAGGQIRCNATCSGLDASGCSCLPGRLPFTASLSLSRNYPRGNYVGTMAYYHLRLQGQPVQGGSARVEIRTLTSGRDQPPVRVDTLGPSGADGTLSQFFPRSPAAAALPAGEYEVTAYLGKGGGRCHDEQTLPPFRIQLSASTP